MTSELLLLVCAANVCRSPFAELLLRRELSGLPGIHVESAGTRVIEPSRICALVRDRDEGEDWALAGEEHRSRAVAAGLLRGASLVLVADRGVRSEVVEALPEVRDRVFTFLDAAHGAEGFGPESPLRGTGTLVRFAAHLDARRAVRGPELARRSLFQSRREVDRSSIRDGHGHSVRAHERSLREVSEAMTVVASSLCGASGTHRRAT